MFQALRFLLQYCIRFFPSSLFIFKKTNPENTPYVHFLKIIKRTSSVVYFDQLSGACSTRKLVETSFISKNKP